MFLVDVSQSTPYIGKGLYFIDALVCGGYDTRDWLL